MSAGTVTYRGQEYQLARSTKAWAWLVPVGERPGSDNTIRISTYQYDQLVKDKQDAAHKRGPMSEERYRKAHRTGQRRPK